jgi:hypothetical protein
MQFAELLLPSRSFWRRLMTKRTRTGTEYVTWLLASVEDLGPTTRCQCIVESSTRQMLLFRMGIHLDRQLSDMLLRVGDKVSERGRTRLREAMREPLQKISAVMTCWPLIQTHAVVDAAFLRTAAASR